jgi:hypothetical protein
LQTARKLRTNLGSTAQASFDGSADANPGVTGVLPVANGGTGRTDGKASGLTNIAVLTGTITLKAPTSGNVFEGVKDGIAYPSGYTKDNCVVIAIGFNNGNSDTTGWGYGTESTAEEIFALQYGGIGKAVSLLPNRITLYGYYKWWWDDSPISQPAADIPFGYKIVLMKVS